MRVERWRRIEELLNSALDHRPNERAALLERACDGDAYLRREVESLLAHDAASADFIETPAAALAAQMLVDDAEGAEDKRAGERVGAYRIVREIGRGGMGAVFLAERDGAEFSQQVALKVVRRSFADTELVHRFRRERQILATLNHPNIAHFLDGGVSTDGEPFFAMEYVEGTRLDGYCAANALSTDKRLKLFLAVCGAVSFAHQRLVIHRDLKPSNILVTQDGTPKLLDFGIAKLLDAEHEGDATQTAFRAFTPEYAAPEQIAGAEITTAADVFSLGVLLENLLCGSHKRADAPHRPGAWMSKGAGDAAKQIVVSNVSTDREKADRTAQISPLKFLNGELKNIIAMARREDASRRYASVQQLAEDVQRYLDGLPVRAQRDSFRYRARKFVARNRVAVAAAIAVLLSLIVGLTVALSQYRHAERERVRAEAVNRFLQDMLSASDPGVRAGARQGGELTVSSVLDEAARSLDAGELAGEPAIRADLQSIVGQSYVGIGKYDEAERNLRAALAAQARLYGENAPQSATTLHALATLALIRADYDEAERIYSRDLETIRREYAAGRVETIIMQAALNNFALVRRARGNSKEAETLLREASALGPKIPEKYKTRVGLTETQLTLTLLDQGKFDEAERRARAQLAEVEKSAPDDAQLSAPLTMLGSILMEKGDAAEAETILRRAETIYRKSLDPNHIAIHDNLRLQAQNLYSQNRLDEAETLIDQVLENYRRNASPKYISYATALTVKGLVLNKNGHVAEAESVLREAVALREANLPAGHFMTALTEGALGECLTAQKRYADAEPFLLKSYDALARTQASENARTLLAKRRLADLYMAWGKPEQLARFR